MMTFQQWLTQAIARLSKVKARAGMPKSCWVT
jgi:hypothetical protein